MQAAFGDGNPAIFPALRKSCQAKSSNALYAIEKYCKNKDLVSSPCKDRETSRFVGILLLTILKVVPSHKAGQGAQYNHARVSIAGPCKPAQWVPPYYCYKQFYTICGKKQKKKKCGKSQCQGWSIANVWV